MINSIDFDGTKKGYDLKVLKRVSIKFLYQSLQIAELVPLTTLKKQWSLAVLQLLPQVVYLYLLANMTRCLLTILIEKLWVST